MNADIIIMMKKYLCTFPLLLILCYDDVGHHKEGVFALKRFFIYLERNLNSLTTIKKP